MEKFEKKPFNTLVLSGGGIKGVLQLGCLHYIDERYLLSDIKKYCGTSVGSIICSLLACGYSPMEIYIKFYKLDIKKHLGIKVIDPLKIFKYIEEFGAIDIDFLFKYVEGLVREKIGYTPTFLELKEKYNITLIIPAVNLNESKVEYFSYLTEPEMFVMDAVRLSCNLPFIFKKITYRNKYYVDGGFLDNFPLSQTSLNDIVLAISVSGNQNIKGGMSFFEYISKIIMLPITEITKLRMSEANRGVKNKNIVHLDIPYEDNPFSLFSINFKKKSELFVEGYNFGETNFNKLQSKKSTKNSLRYFEKIENDEGWEIDWEF